MSGVWGREKLRQAFPPQICREAASNPRPGDSVRQLSPLHQACPSQFIQLASYTIYQVIFAQLNKQFLTDTPLCGLSQQKFITSFRSVPAATKQHIVYKNISLLTKYSASTKISRMWFHMQRWLSKYAYSRYSNSLRWKLERRSCKHSDCFNQSIIVVHRLPHSLHINNTSLTSGGH